MTYALAAPLQTAVYQTLTGAAQVASLVGTHIYDALPTGRLPDLYLTLGAESVVDRSDFGICGAEHRLTISVISKASGFAQAKALAAAVNDTLDQAQMSLSRGRLTFIRFERAQALRTGNSRQLRRIDLQFRARVEDS